MSTITLRLPDSLHERVCELAESDDVSINRFITTAVAEKLTAWTSESYLADRADPGSRAKFERVLRRVVLNEQVAGDER